MAAPWPTAIATSKKLKMVASDEHLDGAENDDQQEFAECPLQGAAGRQVDVAPGALNVTDNAAGITAEMWALTLTPWL